jgi:hypothetical protein
MAPSVVSVQCGSIRNGQPDGGADQQPYEFPYVFADQQPYVFAD